MYPKKISFPFHISSLFFFLDQISTGDVIEKEELVKRLKEKLIKDKREGVEIQRKIKVARKDCPYLDTIKREILDFDFEKVCSVTLKNLNVYACLVCGKYFQGLKNIVVSCLIDFDKKRVIFSIKIAKERVPLGKSSQFNIFFF